MIKKCKSERKRIIAQISGRQLSASGKKKSELRQVQTGSPVGCNFSVPPLFRCIGREKAAVFCTVVLLCPCVASMRQTQQFWQPVLYFVQPCQGFQIGVKNPPLLSVLWVKVGEGRFRTSIHRKNFTFFLACVKYVFDFHRPAPPSFRALSPYGAWMESKD